MHSGLRIGIRIGVHTGEDRAVSSVGAREWRGEGGGRGHGKAAARNKHSRCHGGPVTAAWDTALRTVHQRILGAARVAIGFSGASRFVADGCACYLATGRSLRITWTAKRIR